MSAKAMEPLGPRPEAVDYVVTSRPDAHGETALPADTLAWLTSAENPAVAVMTRRELLGEEASGELEALWARRNEYEPVAAILAAMREDGSWGTPSRDYQKYHDGSLWQVHFLGELWADGSDERIGRAAAYAFSRQVADGSWSCNGRPVASIPCLTANVGRALARLGYARDERVVHALASIANGVRDRGFLGCSREMASITLNGYCHMVAPKILLFLGEVPRDAWPDGAEELLGECVRVLREREVFRCLPAGSRDFADAAYTTRKAEHPVKRDDWIAEHGPLVYGPKPGWLRFGYPLSYNSDALEAPWALMRVGEPMRPEYEAALSVVRDAADEQMRWTLRTSLNGKMIANIEAKGRPSRWLTLRALRVLAHFAE